MASEIDDVIDLAYQAAEQADRSGQREKAAGFESVGRMWYLIKKQQLGVNLDSDERTEIAAFIAKHNPTPSREGGAK